MTLEPAEMSRFRTLSSGQKNLTLSRSGPTIFPDMSFLETNLLQISTSRALLLSELPDVLNKVCCPAAHGARQDL